MKSERRLSVLALAPACDGTDVGEAWCAHQWVTCLADRADVTLLTMNKKGRLAPSMQLPGIEVIEWDDLPLVHRWERFNSMLKPGYVAYYLRARPWIRAALDGGRHFDVAHQFTPIALRYPSPAASLGIPLVIGPLAGSLDTPEAFLPECGNAPWFTRLRNLDRFRLRNDPLLRRTFTDAEVVIGVAPYVKTLLADSPVKRFEMMSELGIHELPAAPATRSPGTGLRLAHVGRVIRTKGLRDVVRAMAMLPKELNVTLEAAGDGEDLEMCRLEAEKAGVVDRITFHGRIAREQVEEIYQRADVFVFPSFREPSGGVIFESLRHGLPVITTESGGPAYVVDDSCGIRVPAESPEDLSFRLASAIRQLAESPQRVAQLSEGARNRMESIGLWPRKIDWLTGLYEDLLLSQETW